MRTAQAVLGVMLLIGGAIVGVLAFGLSSTPALDGPDASYLGRMASAYTTVAAVLLFGGLATLLGLRR